MEADAGEQGGRRLRRRWRVALVVALTILVALAIAWSERRGIAEGVVARELARRGVPARYTVADLGFARQRLTNVVIGDPRRPDLVADWIEVRTRARFGTPEVTGIAAGRVRMRARLIDGRVSLGAIDRLLPPPSGKPFALPALSARLQDVRIRLEAPQGVVGLRLSGAGRLDDGFAGRLAAVSETLDLGGCTATRLAAATAVRVSDAAPTIEGPVRLAALDCGGGSVRGIAADVAASLAPALDRWAGRARLAAASAVGGGIAARELIGSASFAGTARATAGDAAIGAARLASPWGAATGAKLAGRYRAGNAGAQFNGRVSGDASAGAALVARVRALRGTGAGTPIGPIADRLASAGEATLRRFAFDGAVEAVAERGATAVRVAQASIASASGARIAIDGAPLRFGAVEIGGRIATSGGGLPELTADLRRDGRGLAGIVRMAPYAAGRARLALAPVRFVAPGDGTTRIDTVATLSGPLADGAVEGLRMPIAARWRGDRLTVNPACVPLAWTRVAAAGLVLRPARLQLCPIAGALVTIDRGRMGGGARIAAPRLAGTLGGTPLTLAARGAELRLTDGGFALGGVEARLGTAGRVTRIDAARIAGRARGGAIVGDFGGAGGQIGNVPLLLSDAAGRWRLDRGVLTLAGGLAVADAADADRFRPLRSDDVALRLAGGRIVATGTLRTPDGRVRVADVAIDHVLATGAGSATLDVPGIAFAPGALQPDALTPLTFGVVAEVEGSVAGRGRIAWNRDAVTSSGRFGTRGMNLAAAFGPVTGLATEIEFTDLLGLVSAPGQTATVATVNPGIAVENGVVRYRLAGDARVAVEGARWPFAGGELTLDPSVLDFGQPVERRLTFRLAGVDAATFLQQFDFDNLNATGTFDGVLPMAFDERGGRIEGGRLAARAGGSIAYVGTVTEKDVGFWGNLAFQALRALDYRSLDITMNGPLAGEMVTELRFAGVSQGAGTKSNFLIRRLARLPFVFNVTVRAPFRQLIDSVRSYYDPSRLIQRNLPALIDAERRRAAPTPNVQPPESERMR